MIHTKEVIFTSGDVPENVVCFMSESEALTNY